MATSLKQLRKQAEELFNQKQYDDIIELLSDGILEKYNDAELYAWRARAHERNKMPDECITYAQKAIELNPGYWMGYFARGNSWYHKKEYDKAIEDYSKTIELSPKNAIAYSNRGNAWYDKKEYDKAIEDCNKAIELNPLYATAYNGRGLIWYDKKEYDRAIEDFNKAIELNPGYVAAYNNRGLIWYDKKEYDKAIDEYNKAIELNPEYAIAYGNKGLVRSDKREYDKAIEEYNKAIELDPLYVSAYNNRGNTWYDKKKYDKAIEDYNKAIELDPEYTFAYNNRGNSWADKKEYDKAIEDYNKAIELNPEYADAYYNLALTENDSGNIKAAIEHFQKSKEFGHRVEDTEYWINDLREKLTVPLEDEINKGLQKIKNIVSAIRHKSLVENDVKKLVHYSKLVVADIITGDRQSKLHYSNVIYMNDPLEGKTFIDYLDDVKLKAWFERASYKNESTIFLGSFLPVNSRDQDGNAEDQLLMWRTYGKDEDGKDAAGCNFVIDRQFFETEETRGGTPVPESFEEIKAAIEKGDVFTDGNRNSLLKIQYIRGNEILHDKDNVIKELIDYLKEEIKTLTEKNAKETTDRKAKDFTDSRIFDALQEMCHLFKAADYSFEKEVRIIRSEPRNSRSIEYYKGPDGEELKPPKKFYVRSSKRILPYIRKIYLGPKVSKTSHWSLHFDYSIRKEERELRELEDLQKKDSAKLTETEKNRLDSLNETYRGVLTGSEEKINASQVEIIPSSCHFI